MRILRLALFLLGAASVACNSGSQKIETPSSPIIAVIPKGASHEFWKSIHAGAVKASKELGVEIIWKAPVKEADRSEQIKIVEDLTNRGVSGIVMAPADNVALRMPVREAKQVGIPTIIVDSELKSDDLVSFVATDNYKGGREGAKKLAELIGGEGRVVMLRYQEGQASTMKREQGFLDEIASFPEIEVVSSNQYSGLTTETAYQASENLLSTFKDSEGDGLGIDGIFAPCEPVTFGMMLALADLKAAGEVKLVGFDSSDKLLNGLKEGTVHALILQDPVGMGYLGVKLMTEHLSGQSVSTRVDTGVFVATRENMTEPLMAELLKPDLKKWLG